MSPDQKTGSVRVVSKRAGGITATDGETVIDVDRSHPVLGNRHFLKNHLDAVERSAVLASHASDVQKDFAGTGPMHKALAELAQRAAGGEKLALRCWCAPRACHADLYAAKIAEMANVPWLRPEVKTPDPRSASGKSERSRQAGLF